MTLEQRIEEVERRLADACARSGRNRSDIELIAVTKYVGTLQTQNALRHGLTHLGENRWQDAESKWNAITGSEWDSSREHAPAGQAVWHFIGSLQTNKVKDVIGKFTYIHSLDRLSLAQAIERKAEQLGLIVPCFLQVNVSGEESKHGLAPEALLPFAKELSGFRHIKPVGLMTMAPIDAEGEQSRPVFRGLRELRDELNGKAVLPQPVTGLSMGMSGDFEIAVEEGATWLRLGTVLVGKS
ncbi:YggS family pyridoxal phosphate-dependent enzyme [Paenibacillus rhizovicinus]|uniref:Pyridoxal phosphate homeostasis protein n=1 Tax=Paenibacillus rhizovicinus TaxID=2704463 RepID=A0A6C0NVY7_9BACL|nr:YggS family pyridoxal phosphate-dependent enzyme [Paenibacillus rhizovicinus]QHW30360.1 YggS family pyridoxal phosphate-dependent enzyme [Paenibacillus rhizovicinus]